MKIRKECRLQDWETLDEIIESKSQWRRNQNQQRDQRELLLRLCVLVPLIKFIEALSVKIEGGSGMGVNGITKWNKTLSKNCINAFRDEVEGGGGGEMRGGCEKISYHSLDLFVVFSRIYL